MFLRGFGLRRGLVGVGAVTVLGASGLVGAAQLPAQAGHDGGSCQLGAESSSIKHVIELTFDNVHFRRDNPNVPSDVEQMPNLYNFLVGNGTVLNNNHTPLISHTGDDILTTLTGVYGDRHGQPIANTFNFYAADGQAHAALTFAYWTDLAQAFDGTAEGKFNMLTADGKNPPAPWVPFTRAGCNVGAVGTANIELERTANVATVYGPNSPEAKEAADMSDLGVTTTTADFIGVSVHCSTGAALCSSANHGQPDLLPDEPGGYVGFNGLFGHKYVAPQITSTLPMQNLDGAVISNVAGDGTQVPGFPGFNGMSAANSLAYVADMQEHGVQVTYAYLSGVHEQNDTGLGPGDPIYEQNLRNYDEAFGKFFTRLAQDGINKSNTLFIVSADENDHFVGPGPLNPGCDGVNVPCQYDPNKLGNIEVAVDTLLTNEGINTGFQLKSDSAPDYYLNGNPGQNDPATREFERAIGGLVLNNPLRNRVEPMTDGLADQATLRALHMITSDPLRTPTFTQFAKADYAGVAGGLDCGAPTDTVVQCPGVETWNHGDIQPDITTTWVGFVGPGVRHTGINNELWADHTDIRPTLMSLVGLRDDYRHDGRVLLEILRGGDGSGREDGNGNSLSELGQLYKQLNAPVGEFGLAVVKGARPAINSGSAADDSQYVAFDNKLNALTDARNALALKISQVLEAASFGDDESKTHNVDSLIDQTKAIIARAEALAGDD